MRHVKQQEEPTLQHAMGAKAAAGKISPSCSSQEQPELQQPRALFLKRDRPEGPIRNKNQWRLQVHVADQFSGLYPCLLFIAASLIATGVDCSCCLLRIGSLSLSHSISEWILVLTQHRNSLRLPLEFTVELCQGHSLEQLWGASSGAKLGALRKDRRQANLKLLRKH